MLKLHSIFGTDLLYNVLLWFLHCYVSTKRFLIKAFPRLTNKLVRDYFKSYGMDLDGPLESDVQIKNEEALSLLAMEGTVGMGESYINGWVDCKKFDEWQYRACKSGLFQDIMNMPDVKWARALRLFLFSIQDPEKSMNNVKKYYDFGQDWFEKFLGPSMCYSCGYWRDAKNLDEAQYNKMDLIARKLKLKPGMRVLDIGCGWGALCKFLAEKYQVSVVGCTLSPEQVKYGQEMCEGLDVEFYAKDFREIQEKFDRVVSVAMFEHLGKHNLRAFFESANRCLKDDGLFLLHTIVVNDPQIPVMIPYFHKYVFPNHTFPYYTWIMKELEGCFVIEDIHNIGYDYGLTFKAWSDNLNAGWPELKKRYDIKCLRLWTFFFLGASGVFKSRKMQLWHLVLSKDGIDGGYQPLY